MALPTSTFRDMFLRLPPAAAAFLLSTVLGLADGHALLPRQTKTIEPHELNVVMWPPLPTAAPLLSPLELLRRQEYNTICGYLGGDSALPATCSAGSHCVLDEANKVVGCCPNGSSCTTGIFTGCVDQNSGPQTVLNPYVYTCTGSNVCYQNQFQGGFSQYGCGTASNLATTVQTTASGKPSISFPQTTIALTKSPSSLTQSTSESSQSASSSTRRTTTTTSSSQQSSSTSLSLTSTSPTASTHTPADETTSSPSAPSAAAASGSGNDHIGAIVGGTFGGLAFLAALAALLFCLQRRRRNKRRGPGPDPALASTSEYMSPVRSHGAAFAPLPTWQEEEEPQRTPSARYNQQHNQYENLSSAGNMNYVADNAGGAPVSAVSPNSSPTLGGGGWPLAYNAAHVVGGGPGETPIANEYMGGAGAVVAPLRPYRSKNNNNPYAYDDDDDYNNHNKFNNNGGGGFSSELHKNNNNNGSRGMDDFSRDVPTTIRPVQDEETTPLSADTMQFPDEGAGGHMQPPPPPRPPAPASSTTGSSGSLTPSRIRGGDRPLWQQTRRSSRNVMWL